MPLPSPPTALLQALVLSLAPHGGQHAARRNAWAGMVADAQRARAHREAAAAVERAHALAAHRASAAAHHS